jgi:signal transduction histidine kinase
MSTHAARRAAAALALASALLLFTVVDNSTAWIGRTFPGFLVMGNRVVASIALPGWLTVDTSQVFQHQVVAVDGLDTPSAAAVYEYVHRLRPGTPVRYTMRTPEGRIETIVTPARRFTATHYAFLFGAFFLNGIAFIGTALLVYALKPRAPASEGLLAAGLSTGIFVLTAADLYGPHWFFRLHVIAEVMMGASLVHLALVFPTDRLRHRRRAILTGLYLAFALFAVWYEIALESPTAYTHAHLIAIAAHGVGATAVVSTLVTDFLVSRSALVRRRTGVVVVGSLAGFVLPGALMAASATLGGKVPLNAAALTAFLFPLSFGYAVVKRDLFEIDVLLRRAITYVTVLIAMATLYFAVMLGIGVVVPGAGSANVAPATLALANFALLLLMAPIRSRVQAAVDRVFFRIHYQPEHALSELSHGLAGAHTLDEVVRHMRAVFARTFCPISARLYLAGPDARFRRAGHAGGGPEEFVLPADLLARAERNAIVARYEWEDGSGDRVPEIWHALEAELLVPIRTGAVTGLIVLGGQQSGRPYTLHDINFLDAAGSQVGLAVTTAEAFESIRRAYERLEQNQASLIRADRLTTLGRLTAGMAHEVNTPLGAVLNSLRLIADLGREYAEAVGKPEVEPDDHHQIANEIVLTAENASRWAAKAAAFVARVKMQGRESAAQHEEFLVEAVVVETRALLAHRLHATSCRIELEEEPAGVTLVGDPAQLGQVLVNLVGNAIDAYEDAGLPDGLIVVSARRADGIVTLTVRDQAGGIADDILARLFEELVTTKERGRGTGLGLWVARNLIEQSFGGTLRVETTPGIGSAFIATIPVTRGRPARAA